MTSISPVDAFHFYEPQAGHGLPHDPFKAIIGPRPIGWIASQDKQGAANLAPYSFFNAFSNAPPIIGFASDGRKDSVQNIEATGEFTWNLVTRSLAQAMNTTCTPVGPEVDEFALAGLEKAASRTISVPRVAQARVSFECRLTQIIRLLRADGQQTQSWLVLGEVVGVHIDRSLLVDGIYDTAAALPISRGGGTADYFETTPGALFKMRRPKP